MRVGPPEPRARAGLDRRRASYARRCRFESCRAHDIPPPSGSGLALRRQGWAFESPRGDLGSVMRPVSQLRCLRSERGSTPLRIAIRCGSSWSSSGSYKPALPADSREVWVRFPAAARGRGANGDAAALRAAWPGIVPRRPHDMAAYPNLRQRDHVENVFSIGSNPIAATPTDA